MVGCENHIPVLKSFSDVEIAGICRLGKEDLKKLQERFGISYGTENWEELLSLEGLDGVVISSPHHLHFQHSVGALQRRVHVLCEKPMALLAAEAEQIASLVEKRNLHFVVPYGWSFTDYAREARYRVLTGEIGIIQHVHCHMSSALKDLFSGEGAWFAETSFFKPELQTWSDPVIGGGYAQGQLTHALGLLLWISGLEAKEVFAFMGTSRTGADICDALSCRFQSGAVGVVGGAGLNPPGAPDQVDIRLFGSEGMLLLDIERPRLEIVRYDGRNYSMSMAHTPGEYFCTEPLRVFIDLIEGKDVENPAGAFLGAQVVRVIDAALRSAKSAVVEKV